MVLKKKRHSKFRNTGILFELLTKQVTADIITGRDFSPAKDLLHKYFKESTELGREWQLYNTLLNDKIKASNLKGQKVGKEFKNSEVSIRTMKSQAV